MWRRRAIRSEDGQASPEWIGLTLLLALLFAAALTVLGPLPLAISLARGLGDKLVCAVHLSDTCERESELVDAYGADLAHLVRAHAPAIFYERGMRALPVDFRSCRVAACADAGGEGVVWRSRSGEPATAFVHVIDCRPRGSSVFTGGIASADCSGGRAGNVYLQFWFYYPDSATLRGVPVAGAKGYHRDDWESAQVRITPHGGIDTRASSHRGYNYRQGPQNWGAEAGIEPLRSSVEAIGASNRNGWGPETGVLFVSGGSHAGNAKAVVLRYASLTPTRRLALIPLESIATGDEAAFAISPPWLKKVWRDPEDEGTS